MMALVDTDVMLDFLRGEPCARRALDACEHRAISVLTWLDLMAQCPPGLGEPTRGFLRSFERLSLNEAIADEALRLLNDYPDLPQACALNWATARLNQMTYLTADARFQQSQAPEVMFAYAG